MRRAPFVLALLLVAGCDSFGDVAAVDAGTRVSSVAELAAAQAAWDADGPADYRLAYDLACLCAGGDRVTVRNGRVASAARLDVRDALTVDDLFAQAREVFAEGRTGEVRLSAGTPRIPVLISLQAVFDPDAPVADEPSRLTVTGFEAD